MKIDYNYMDSDALKKTYLLCRARGNTATADEIQEIMIRRGIAAPNADGTKISFTKVNT